MKTLSSLFSLLLVAFVLNACQPANQQTAVSTDPVPADSLPSTGNFGATITEDGAMAISVLDSLVVPGEEYAAKVEGEIVEVCQSKGCWMKVRKSDGSEVRITFKDYGYFVPKDGAGKWAVLEGVAFYDTLSVETLRHYAEDAGKSADEIAAITKPEYKIAFEAAGVIIK